MGETKIRYATFADDLDSCGYNRLEASAIQHFIKVENVAKHNMPAKDGATKNEWGGSAGQNPNNKVDRLLRWLGKMPKEQLVIYADASSTAFVTDTSVALRAYAEILGAEQASVEDPERPCKELSSRVVLGAEASSNGLEWADDAFWLDFEGSFRETTVWVNGRSRRSVLYCSRGSTMASVA